MSKTKIQNFYKEKIKLLDNYNKFYYEKSLPKVSDQTYDELKEEFLVKYMPAPNADPHGGIEDFVEHEKLRQQTLEKNPNVDEMV